MARSPLKQVIIYINTVNDAFVPDAKPELARILRELANRIETRSMPVKIMDANGNQCGEVQTYRTDGS